MPYAATDSLLKRLAQIVDAAKTSSHRLGLFAALYHRMTFRIRTALEQGRFDDGDRMDRFAGRFGSRYIAAYEGLAGGSKVSEPWRIAFATATSKKLTILQDILTGINAHVNLDLGVAAAEVADGSDIYSLSDDFHRVNDLLEALIDPTEAVVAQHSPVLDVLDSIGGRTDEELVNFSLRLGRENAWSNAVTLYRLAGKERVAAIAAAERHAALLGRRVAEPGFPLDAAIRIIKLSEDDKVRTLISELDAV
jgi:hypothetical protein